MNNYSITDFKWAFIKFLLFTIFKETGNISTFHKLGNSNYLVSHVSMKSVPYFYFLTSFIIFIHKFFIRNTRLCTQLFNIFLKKVVIGNILHSRYVDLLYLGNAAEHFFLSFLNANISQSIMELYEYNILHKSYLWDITDIQLLIK